MASDKSLRHMTQFISNKLGKQQSQQDIQSDGPHITRTLQSIRDFAQSSEKRAAIEKLKFIHQHNSTARITELEGLIEAANEQSSKSGTTALASVTKLAKTLADVHYTALDDYLASNYTVMGDGIIRHDGA